MFWNKMPRTFWSYTAGKGDTAAEEREVARDCVLRFYLDQISEILRPG